MAEKVSAVKAYDPEELVTTTLFKDNGKYKDDVFVCVNGKTCQIQRGVEVQVKRKFLDVYEQSLAQDMKTADMMQNIVKATQNKAASL